MFLAHFEPIQVLHPAAGFEITDVLNHRNFVRIDSSHPSLLSLVDRQQHDHGAHNECNYDSDNHDTRSRTRVASGRRWVPIGPHILRMGLAQLTHSATTYYSPFVWIVHPGGDLGCCAGATLGVDLGGRGRNFDLVENVLTQALHAKADSVYSGLYVAQCGEDGYVLLVAHASSPHLRQR